MTRERQLYREAYRRGALRLNESSLPVLKHETADGRRFKAIACEITAAGVVERPDGSRVEYQDMRVYLETET